MEYGGVVHFFPFLSLFGYRWITKESIEYLSLWNKERDLISLQPSENWAMEWEELSSSARMRAREFLISSGKSLFFPKNLSFKLYISSSHSSSLQSSSTIYRRRFRLNLGIENEGYHSRVPVTRISLGKKTIAYETKLYCCVMHEGRNSVHMDEMITGAIEEMEAQSLATQMDIQVGKTPIMYLGIPLISERLNIKECLPLVEKILVRINNY